MNNYTDEDIRKIYKRNFGNVEKVKEITGLSDAELKEAFRRMNIVNTQKSKRSEIARLLTEGHSVGEIEEMLDVSNSYVKNVQYELRMDEILKAQEQRIRVRVVTRKKPVAYPIMIRGRMWWDVTEEFMEKISLEHRDMVIHEDMCV